VTREEAIRMYTANGAHHTWEEKEKGSLEAGKLADMCVIEQDPLKVADSELLTMNVDMTFVGGKMVYRRPEARA
jgi:predicted amidohydrolase YtcJ